MDTTKDFAPILSDYAFFEARATEAVNDAAAYARVIAPLVAAGQPLRMLDFGCGTGTFTERLLRLVQIPPPRLQLALVEPVAASPALAAERVARFSASPIEHANSLAAIQQPDFDLIVANHVLYYVPDLPATLAALIQRLAPGGRLLTAIAGNDNTLIQFCRAGFAMIGRPMPYHMAEDVAAALGQLGLAYEKHEVPYDLIFDDTEANRLTILRFLFSEHLTEMPRPAMLDLFTPFARGGQIQIHTACWHFSMGRPG
ncbi:MAG TPA: class I SAM-dependent methyltransferase [Pirellulaceae bacterium]|nr:class I SAM-dependent methyltransferase [Pirellulaceae bacterium]